ncbi:hypothetical protein D9M69_658200 [compost metagenome]
MRLAVGAGHVEVDQGQVELVGGAGKQFVDAHRQDELDASSQLRQLGFDRLDDEPVVVGDQNFHGIPQCPNVNVHWILLRLRR